MLYYPQEDLNEVFPSNVSMHEYVTQDPSWACSQILRLRKQVEDLSSRLKDATEVINAAYDAISDAPELNPCNYDHDQVCKLNQEMCYAFSIINEYLAEQEEKNNKVEKNGKR